MRTLFAAACSVFLLAPLAAQQPPRPLAPSDFAWQWPLQVASEDGVGRLTLTPEVYAQLQRADLSDLAAFNAADEAIPLGPAALAFERLRAPAPPAPVEVPLFRVPRETAAGGDRVELHIARGADGRLTRLDATVEPQATQVASDVLLDVSAIQQPVTALRVELDDGAIGDGLNARVEVAGSDDLANWRVLASGLALVSLRDAGLSLERRELEFPRTDLPYLRLRRIDADAALPVRAVLAQPAQQAGPDTIEVLPPREEFVLRGEAVADAPGQFIFRSSGPFPAERIAVELADANSVAGFVLESRDADQGAWIERARSTAFRIGTADKATASAPLNLALNRDRQWRLRTEPAQARAPTLRLWYRPDQVVLLTQGQPPYRLAAGSRARRPDYPLRTVLSELRQTHGDLWLPPAVSLGTGSPLAGDAALSEPPPPPPYKQWLLWGVLIVGALGVIVMVLKLMKAPPSQA